MAVAYRRINFALLLALFVASVPARAHAQAPDSTKARVDSVKAAVPDTTQVRTFGGFVDTYYAWDTDQPHNFDRAYTTQPARHAEFNVNLVYIETKWSGPRYRGRLALQWGTSVEANYADEPKIGGVSGSNVSQFIQEATVGYQLAPSVWLDGGIFFSHIGYESWISRDDLAYSRSLVADFSPYYEAGVKVTWTASPKLTATFALVNGWQDISNYNTPPAGGVRFDYTPTRQLTLTYDDFVGNTAPDSAPARLRVYHDLIGQFNPEGKWQFAAQLALGTQTRSTPEGGTATWWGMTSYAKYHATPTLAFVGRVEHYTDPNQVLVVTGLPASFDATGGSFGIDVNLKAPVLWRTEIRGLHSTNAVWPLHEAGTLGRNDVFAVTSLALTF
jgi:hypothetical protein